MARARGGYHGGSSLEGSSVGYVKESTAGPRWSKKRRPVREEERIARAAKRAQEKEQQRIARSVTDKERLQERVEEQEAEALRQAAHVAKRRAIARGDGPAAPVVVVVRQARPEPNPKGAKQ